MLKLFEFMSYGDWISPILGLFKTAGRDTRVFIGPLVFVLFFVAFVIESALFNQAVGAGATPSGCFHRLTQFGMICVMIGSLLFSAGIV